MIIKNVWVYQENKTFKYDKVLIENGIFVSEVTQENEIMDGQGCYAIPGLIDIHFHGCVGEDLCDGNIQAIEKIANYEASIGVTSIVPATMTVPVEQLHHIMKTAAVYKNGRGAKLVGINMEGPFINAAKRGAQAAKHILECDVALFKQLQEEANGLIKIVDIAPEKEGAMTFIDAVKDEVVVSLAHTTAQYDIAKEAYERGARHTTHLYNAMPPFSHRAPGVVGAALDSTDSNVELICDNIHIHPTIVRATFKMFGKDRIIMISDSMRATGLKDGEYMLGGQNVKVVGHTATLEDGTIAGSVTNLMECVRVAVKEMDIPLEVAIGCATINPARAIGIYDRYGSITPGKVGDLVLLNSDLTVKAVYIEGERYYMHSF